MKESNIFHKILGILCIIIGIIFYVTPIPGTTLLIILGFILLIGKDRTVYFLKEVLSKKVFEFLKVERIVEKL